MTEEGRQQASGEELKLADEELRAAAELVKLGLARIAMTRVYFAVFHAVRARLFVEGLSPTSHRGAQHLFNVHFVKNGRYPPETSRLVARLHKFREEADYTESFVVDSAGAQQELAAAGALVERIRAELALATR